MLFFSLLRLTLVGYGVAPNPIVEPKASYCLGASAGVWEDETVNAGHGGHQDNNMGVRLTDRDSAHNGCVL